MFADDVGSVFTTKKGVFTEVSTMFGFVILIPKVRLPIQYGNPQEIDQHQTTVNSLIIEPTLA